MGSESGLVFLGHAGQCEGGERETRKEGGLGQPLVVCFNIMMAVWGDKGKCGVEVELQKISSPWIRRTMCWGGEGASLRGLGGVGRKRGSHKKMM